MKKLVVVGGGIGPQVASGQDRPLRSLEAHLPGVWRIFIRFSCITFQGFVPQYTVNAITDARRRYAVTGSN